MNGPGGFENRKTFQVVNRDWPGTAFTTNTNGNDLVIHTANYVVRVPANAGSLDGVRVESTDGRTLYMYDGKLTNSQWLPAPADQPVVWSFADSPRLVPPPWGLTPPAAPKRSEGGPPKPMPNGGWDWVIPHRAGRRTFTFLFRAAITGGCERIFSS